MNNSDKITIASALIHEHHSSTVSPSPPSLSIHGQTHSPTAAIVRRLYYSPSASGQQHQSPISSRTNPYRSMMHLSHSNNHRIVSTATRIVGSSSKGVAKVTPISIQSPTFDSTIRLTSRPTSTILMNDNNNKNNRLLQKPSTSLIQILEAMDSNNSSQASTNTTTTTTTTTTTVGPIINTINQTSHRHGKSLQEIASTSTTTTASITTTTKTLPPINNSSHYNENINNLCFLSHGGSSETFTVNEAVEIDSVIGTIKFRFNASSSSSSIGHWMESHQPHIPIRIEPGTKKLILVRKLDKESVEGESSVTIAIRCRPKRLLLDKRKLARKLSSNDQHESNWNRVEKRIATDESIDQSYLAYDTITDTTSDDDIIIPIRILVTDANDNKPEWQGNVPYSVNISEMSSPGSVVLTGIRAIDNDQLGPYSTVEYYVEPGPYSHLLRFASPLEGTLLLAAQLDYETLPKFWVSIRAQDQGNPPNTAVTKVNVQVIDADDQNPRFEVDKYTAILGEGQITAHPLQVKPKPIRAEDPDRAIQSQIVYEFNSKDEDSRENAYFKINAQTGQVSLKRPLHSSVALPITLVIRATQLDNRDRYALTTLTIVSKRDQVMPELRFLHSNYSTSLLESTPPGQVVLTVQSSRPASTSNQPLRFQILDDEHGYFSIKNSGEIVVNRMLDYEKHHRYSFRVMVTDGLQTDLARVTIDIINVNEHDPVFGQSTYVFHVNEARLRSSPVIGQMQATDADDGDRVQLSLSGPHAAAFALSADGTLRLRSLRLVNTTECHMIATATDSGTPSRSSSASVVVKFASALLKSLAGRTLESLLFELEHQTDLSSSPAISPTAVDILQHSSANIFSASTNSTALVLVIVLGVLLGTLFIIIVALTLHVLKNRKYESRRSSNCSPVTLHQRHHISSSSASSASSSSSSSDLSLSGGHHHHHHHHHPHHAHHQHIQHQHHWPTKDDSPERLFSANKSLFQPTAVSMVRSNKVVPLDSNTSNNDEYTEDIDSNAKKLLENLSPVKRSLTTTTTTMPNSNSSIEQPDSAISSDISCQWSDSHKISTHSSQANNSRSQSEFNSDSTHSDININPISTCSPTPDSNASRISVIRWPQGSIPRRVKKLTWKDEQRNNHLDQLYTSNSIVQAQSKQPKRKH
ncbi:protocadherin fat 1-like protein [Dermatophagoides farinae]|uniref:Protocadherin fat 1-like protein n=1 Tax=Dermatophagoides farinae TaxID=6954 RepID=A0A9D4P5A2_DERFA|nr:protocadherin fat 1-like protein [Dermatophagoides farinae]